LCHDPLRTMASPLSLHDALPIYIERAEVVLVSVGGGPVQQIATRVGVSRPMVWRWQQRFAEEGVDGLVRDKTRKPGKPPIAAETDRKSTRLNSSHSQISYAVFCL